ncbi:MAG: carboxypeptidase-like regulatory domain-containing protein [Chlorobi bacterium]|nr:carboxypeptidase-like regulatory domain-containing protein [Chlorobiota bacterium]
MQGVVTDTAGQTMAFANIMAREKDKEDDPRFFITDEHGKFDFHLKAGKNYTVKIFYLGYRTASFDIDSTQRRVFKKIVLVPEAENLEAVELWVRMPVTVREDSVIYVADSFRSGREWKLKDLLKKLPGMEVSKEGEIRVMGKKVTKVLVENKPFFGGNPKFAVENIPADAVDEIEALDDYTDIGFMREVDDRNQLVLNIKLKKGKERFFFGDMAAAAGVPQKYTVNPHVYYYSPRTQAGLMGFAGNTEQNPVTFKDIVRLHTIHQAFDFQGITSTYKLISPLMQGEFFRNRNTAGALQWHGEHGKNSLGVFALGFGRHASAYTRQLMTRLGTGYTEESITGQEQSRLAGIIKADARHKASVWNYMDFHFRTSRDRYDATDRTEGFTGEEVFWMDQHVRRRDWEVENEGIWYRKLHRQWIVKGVIRHVFTSQRRANDYSSSYPLFDELIDWPDGSSYRMTDTLGFRSSEANAMLKVYYLLTKRFHVYLTGSYTHRADSYAYAAYNRAADTSAWHVMKEEDFYALSEGRTRTAGGEIRFKYSTRRFLARGGWRMFRWNGPFASRTLTFPFAYVRYRFSRSRTFTAEWEGKPLYPEFPDLVPGFTVAEIRTVQRGNPGLLPRASYRFRALFRDFNILKNYSFYSGFTYETIPRAVLERVEYAGPVMIRQKYLSPHPFKTFRVFGSARYYFRAFYLRLQYEQNRSDLWRLVRETEIRIKRRMEKYRLETGLWGKERMEGNTGFVWRPSVQSTETSQVRSRSMEWYAEWAYSPTPRTELRIEYSVVRLNDRPPLPGGRIRLTRKDRAGKWRIFAEGVNLFRPAGVYTSFEGDIYFEREIKRMPPYAFIGVERKL